MDTNAKQRRKDAQKKDTQKRKTARQKRAELDRNRRLLMLITNGGYPISGEGEWDESGEYFTDGLGEEHRISD